MNVGVDTKIINNKDILSITFDQELTSKEKYSLGFLDGKKYARNQMENLILGIPLNSQYRRTHSNYIRNIKPKTT